MTTPVETTAHALCSTGMSWRERADRASTALFAMSTDCGQSSSHDTQKPPHAERGWGSFAGAGRRTAVGAGGDDLGAGRDPCGVSTDEHGIAVAVGVDQPEVAAQGEEHGREAALVDEVAFHCGPVPRLRMRQPWAEALRGAAVAARQFREEGQGVGHGASLGMDHQVDGTGAPLAAQMVVEHEAVDGDDRSETPPASVVVGIAAVAEGAGDVFEGTAAQPLCLQPPIPWA